MRLLSLSAVSLFQFQGTFYYYNVEVLQTGKIRNHVHCSLKLTHGLGTVVGVLSCELHTTSTVWYRAARLWYF